MTRSNISTHPQSLLPPLKMLAQSYIRDTVGTHNVDDVITTGKSEIQSEIKEKLTNRMMEEDIGLAVVNITISGRLSSYHRGTECL